VIPDIFITLVEGRYLAIMNESRFPSLVISERNRRVLESPSSPPEEKRYVREKYSKASHFLRSIEERQQTVRRIAEFLADFQKGFFDNGVDHLMPLTLQQVADALGYSQSTISRAINGKYLESPQGIHELRFFFSRRLAGSEGISTRTAKEELRRIVEEEDPRNPFSDEVLVNLLRARGLAVKRRTVANYRTQLNIPPARQRRRF
jgi:RNA polymerase sigma-54 factor